MTLKTNFYDSYGNSLGCLHVKKLFTAIDLKISEISVFREEISLRRRNIVMIFCTRIK